MTETELVVVSGYSVELLRHAGILLARGLTLDEILDELKLTVEEGIALLKSVYAGWRQQDVALALLPNDQKTWHINVRLQLLQKAMKSDNPQIRSALAVLDSIAALQGFSINPNGSGGAVLPLDGSGIQLQVVLVPKPEPPVAVMVEGENR